MNRITLVFPSKAEAERAYQDLRSSGAAQGLIALLGDNDPRLDSGLSAHDSSGSQEGGVPVIAPLGATAGFAATTGNGVVSGAAPAYAAAAMAETVPGRAADFPSVSDREQSALMPGGMHRDEQHGDTTSSPASSGALGAYTPQEAQYYQNALSQGRAVLTVELLAGEDEARVRQILGQYDGHPYLPASSGL